MFNTNKKNIFISTPIYYINSDLHLGHCYTTILADTFQKHQKSMGHDVFFVTGCDVHGEKVYNSIQELLKKDNPTKEEILFVIEERKTKIKQLWKELKIDFDFFISTSDKSHIKNVQNIFYKFFLDKKIYLGTYKGYYSLKDECYYSIKEIKEKNIDINRLKILEENNYFLNFDKVKNDLKKYLNQDGVLLPSYRREEVLNYFFIENNLNDLSITRSKVKWGIQNPLDKNSTIYVWFDALLNYLSSLGYQNNKKNLLSKFWTGKNTWKVQFIGKEIIRFHAIYWPAILLNLKLPLPDKLVSHGWLIFDDKKMSKTDKNIIDPIDFLKKYNFEYLRYFFIYNADLKIDFSFSEQIFKDVINKTLINNLGNFINRVFHLIKKEFNGTISFGDNIVNKRNYQKIIETYCNHIDNFEFKKGIFFLLQTISTQNKHLNDTEPWKNINNNNRNIYISYFQNYFIIINITFFLLSSIFVDSYKNFVDSFIIYNGNEYTKNIPSLLADFFNLNFFKNKKFKLKKQIKIIFKKID